MAPSSSKKRKPEAESGSQVMSAFALRRKFLKQTAPSSLGSDSESTQNDGHATPALSTELGSPAIPQEPRSLSATSAVTSPKRTALPARFSTFTPNKKNCLRKSDGRVVLKLPEGERLVVLGSYGIKVISGEITIAGATLRPSERTTWCHAPHCHALPVLRCPIEANVELIPHPSASNLRKLEMLSPAFGRLWNEPTESGAESFQLLCGSSDGPKKALIQMLNSPAEWNRKIVSLLAAKQVNSGRILICGPKSSGKSTISRLLSNRLLTDESTTTNSKTSPKVAVLDIDPGQPEFSTPGHMSLVLVKEPLIEPPFCHPFGQKDVAECLASHAFDSISPGTNVEHYIECVVELYAAYKQLLLGKCPLVINTPGWVQGTGLDILTELTKELNPTEVIYMSEDGPEETVEGLKAAARNTPFTQLPSQSSEYTSRTALHLRTMQAMSYFHLDVPNSNEGPLRWNATSLTSIPPLSIRYAGPNPGIMGIMCYDYQAPIELLTETINGSVISIVRIRDQKAFREPPPKVERSPEGLLFFINQQGHTLDPRYSSAIGSALIRGIDTGRGEIQLLCPIPLEHIEEKMRASNGIVLVSGKLDPPSWAYTEDLYNASFEDLSKDEVLGVAEENTDDDNSEDLGDEPNLPEESNIPWIEKLHGNQKRAVGSKVWRVRRDLGKSNATE